MKGDATPTIQEQTTIRPKDMLQVFDNKLINNTTPQISDSVPCAAFKKFGLYVYVGSTSTPTTLRIEVEFLDRWSGKWHSYKQGLFAALYYEDTDVASGVYECFAGDVLGRAMQVKLTGAGTSGSAYFNASISMDFWN